MRKISTRLKRFVIYYKDLHRRSMKIRWVRGRSAHLEPVGLMVVNETNGTDFGPRNTKGPPTLNIGGYPTT